ncbi:ABC transporter substrate-binding protein, partial [Acinetobacter baumannii]
LVFRLRPDATFHDGRPVTAADVKWSLDRAVSLPASKRQLATGSLTQPAQFVVVDQQTLRIDLPRPDRYTLPNLALTFASILNSELARQHAT